MTKTHFFQKFGDRLVIARADDPEYGDFLFLYPEENDIVQEFDPEQYQVVSVHETDGEDDHVDMSVPCDFGFQPFKYGYFVLLRHPSES